MHVRKSPARLLLALAAGTTLAAGTSLAAQGIPPVRVPPGNPITTAKVQLGKALFFEEQLSSNGSMSCATCHLPEAGGGDPRAGGPAHPGFDRTFRTADDVFGSPGVVAHDANGDLRDDTLFGQRPQVTPRKAPPAILAAYNPLQLWDGRSGDTLVDPLTRQVVLQRGASLEAQALLPVVDDVEMNHAGADWRGALARLQSARPLALATNLPADLDTWLGTRGYPDLFREVFGDSTITAARVAMAIATYERTLISDQAPYDRFLAGQTSALTPQEQRGLAIFNGPARCNTCHGGALTMAPARFVNTGVRPAFEDRGRFVVTNDPRDDGAFKIPHLRNIAQRAPYFHNGSARTLRQVVDFYARGGNQNRIRGFRISPTDRDALVAFLSNALTDPRVPAATGPFTRPTLNSETPRVARPYGIGAPGSGGFEPRLSGFEPPHLGNRNMTLGLEDGLGGAPTALLADPGVGTGQRILGVPLQVAASPQLVVLPLGTLGRTGPGAGWTSIQLAIPDDRSLAGVALHLQAIVADPGAAQGLAASAGLRFAPFAPR